MSYHGSGMDSETYYTIRAYMFGDDLLSEWSPEELANMNGFIDWAVEQHPWKEQLGIDDEQEFRELCAVVFRHELEEYINEKEDANNDNTEITTWKVIGSTGNSLILKITDECRLLNLDRGDKVKITITKL